MNFSACCKKNGLLRVTYLYATLLQKQKSFSYFDAQEQIKAQ